MKIWQRLLGARSDDPARFGRFLGARAAFVAQKTVLDYCQVKAAGRERAVFADPDFQAALSHCRWQVYIAALADILALGEAWLRPHAPGRAEALAKAFVALHDAALAAEPVPAEESEAVAAARLAFPGHLVRLQSAPPWSADRMPLLAEAPLFATLPVPPEQRRGEAPAIRGALRFHTVSMQQEMERLFDAAGLAASMNIR
jgi:hypothetical protein